MLALHIELSCEKNYSITCLASPVWTPRISISCFVSLLTLLLSIYYSPSSLIYSNYPLSGTLLFEEAIKFKKKHNRRQRPLLHMHTVTLLPLRSDSSNLVNSWHKNLNWYTALTESVYKLQLEPIALNDADNQKATTHPRDACLCKF